MASGSSVKWKVRTRGIFTHPKKWLAKLFEEPRKLWIVFSLRLSLVLCLATTIPILVLFLLSKWGFIEASQELDFEQPVIPDSVVVEVPTPTMDGENRNSTPESSTPSPEVTCLDLPLKVLEGDPIRLAGSPISFDPETGTWQVFIKNAHFVFSSNIFRFRVKVPAWFTMGSLPILSLMIGVVLSIWMSRSVTGPFSRLAQAAHAIGRRDLKVRIQAEGSQELHDLAQSFNRMAEQLEQAETTRRNLMADVAHELRTPLAVLDGNLRAMLDGVHAMNDAEIALLYEQTHHLNRLVDDLRELSLAESNHLSLDLQPVDLFRLVGETAAHFEPIAREQGITLSIEPGEGLIHPALDDHRLRQALHNLLANALRHTPPGGTVKVSVGKMAEENGYEITVTDTGVGISPEDLPHIFDRFYRAARTPGNGTGLGLAIVQALTKAQGGRVLGISPGVGMGSTFILIFPIAG